MRANIDQDSQFFSSLSGGRYFYTDISHPSYWRTYTATAILFPLVVIIMLILVFYIRRLYLHNQVYREKIEAQQNLVILGAAAATLAHEIKNPLLSIRLHTGILEKTAAEQGKNEISIINQEVERLSSLVYRVNDYLREPAGNRIPIDLNALLAETFSRICGESRADIGNKINGSTSVTESSGPADGNASSGIAGNEVSSNAISSVPAVIFADENRIRSVLENILRNAVESESPPGEIGYTLKTGDGKVIIGIYDRGKGIAENDMPRIFNLFFTSKSGGTGIGLAISRRFAEAAGGSINIENRKNGGIIVTLSFPLYDEENNNACFNR